MLKSEWPSTYLNNTLLLWIITQILFWISSFIITTVVYKNGERSNFMRDSPGKYIVLWDIQVADTISKTDINREAFY